MKKIFLFIAFSFSLSGCVVGFIPTGAYPVATGYTPYAAPIYGSYYNPPPAVYYGGYGRSDYAPAYYARPHGPTPFEVVFGKGALKQPNNNRNHRR